MKQIDAVTELSHEEEHGRQPPFTIRHRLTLGADQRTDQEAIAQRGANAHIAANPWRWRSGQAIEGRHIADVDKSHPRQHQQTANQTQPFASCAVGALDQGVSHGTPHEFNPHPRQMDGGNGTSGDAFIGTASGDQRQVHDCGQHKQGDETIAC